MPTPKLQRTILESWPHHEGIPHQHCPAAAGVVEGSGDDQFPDGSRVMFTGPYGVFENGAFSEWVAVKKAHLCLVPENIGDAAAGLPVAYLHLTNHSPINSY
jgi:NADPH:quinone reductase-like Zn-dependent oxidoreductase